MQYNGVIEDYFIKENLNEYEEFLLKPKMILYLRKFLVMLKIRIC